MNPKISVIVPVYNTGELLRDTIESILAQTFCEFELILIDDGSKDCCPKICDEYAKKDQRVIVIHQSNSGICGARNAGISVAKGEYITFCDHDDLYMPELLETEYRLAMETNADLVNVGCRTEFDNGEVQEDAFVLRCLTRDEIARNIFTILEGHISCVWRNLYRRATFRGNFIFDTKYTRGHEDVNFNLKILKDISKFVATDALLYRHVVRKNLSTSAKIHIEVIEGYIDEILNFNGCVQSLSIDIDKEKLGYGKILSEMLRSLCVYMAKAGLTYSKYKKALLPLNSILKHATQLNITNNTYIPGKDRFLIETLLQSKMLAYIICKLFVFLKR